MKNIKSFFQYGLIILMVSCLSCDKKRDTDNKNTNNNLQTQVDYLRRKHRLKGISVGAYIPNRQKLKGVSGKSHLWSPITSNMKFGIASNSKLFTSVMIMKLVENQILTIDDSISKWLNPIKNVNPNTTIRQLLNHSSGINDFIHVKNFNDSIYIDGNRVFSPSEIIKWIDKPISGTVGCHHYSSSNYVLLGMIIERATNNKLEVLIRDSILIPHNLNNTFFPPYEFVPETIAHPWKNRKDINRVPRKSLLSTFWAAGAMYSNTDDMISWYRKLFDGKIIAIQSLKTITTFEGEFGLGIIKYDFDGRTVFGHAGILSGYRSFMLYDPETKAIVCVLINQNKAEPEVIAKEILFELIK